jgi:16S rRNA (cytosine967-C5)-methyltransferase
MNIIESLLKILDIDRVKDYLRGLNLRSLPEVRVNQLKTEKNNISKLFKKNLIEGDNLSPSCIKLNKHLNFNTLNEYSDGLFEVQADGSQVISLLAYNDEKTILDACAGAGGKSLHLADLSKNNAKITSLDTDKIKIKELIKRKQRAAADSIFAFSVKPFNANILKDNKFELVLIDAPCSGTGTAKRDPSRKIFLNSRKILSYADYQIKLLEYYSQFVKSHGKLIYATCSILPEENELVVEHFLQINHNFELFEPIENLTNYNLKHKLSSNKIGFYRVHPLHHSTDGFFIATLRKKA